MKCLTLIPTVFAAWIAATFVGCGQPAGNDPKAASPRPVAARTQGSASQAEPKITTAPKPIADDELADGFVALFDGETLFGWRAESNANWRVEQGAIVVDSGEAGLLCTTTEFSDYVLRFEFRASAETNSGVFLHTPRKPTDPGKDCYELNIAGPDNAFPTGSLVQRAKAEVDAKPDQWHAVEVTVLGDRITVKLDDKQAVDYTDGRPLRRGRIGLQLNQGVVAFRHIRLRPTGLANMLNGRDLAGWKTYADQPSRFTLTPEGWLNVKNGRGQLESEQSYGDFVMQLECITHAPELNSGVFFRCIPGQFMNGYEIQIQNSFKNGDRRQPKDCGTGGVFRNSNARLVVPDDKQWFSETIVAHGSHVAVWVNGYQVTDWIDERAAHENPRNGRRTQPGTIMLQGHDPTTDISFRNLRITEFPQRIEPGT